MPFDGDLQPHDSGWTIKVEPSPSISEQSQHWSPAQRLAYHDIAAGVAFQAVTAIQNNTLRTRRERLPLPQGVARYFFRQLRNQHNTICITIFEIHFYDPNDDHDPDGGARSLRPLDPLVLNVSGAGKRYSIDYVEGVLPRPSRKDRNILAEFMILHLKSDLIDSGKIENWHNPESDLFAAGIALIKMHQHVIAERRFGIELDATNRVAPITNIISDGVIDTRAYGGAMITEFKAGNVFMLDFGQFDPEPYEMTKRRMVVVVSSRSLRRDKRLATIVPLSTSAPKEANAKHCIPLSRDYYWGPRDGTVLWAKCDMIRTISIEKLEHLTAVTRRGQNHVPVPELKRDDLMRVRLGVGHAIDLDDLIVPEAKRELRSYLKRFRAKFSRSRKGRGDAVPPPSA